MVTVTHMRNLMDEVRTRRGIGKFDLPASGQISAGDINEELGRSRTAEFNIGGVEERGLAGIANGQISFSDFHGKSSVSPTQVRNVHLSYIDFNTLRVMFQNSIPNAAPVITYYIYSDDVYVTSIIADDFNDLEATVTVQANVNTTTSIIKIVPLADNFNYGDPYSVEYTFSESSGVYAVRPGTDPSGTDISGYNDVFSIGQMLPDLLDTGSSTTVVVGAYAFGATAAYIDVSPAVTGSVTVTYPHSNIPSAVYPQTSPNVFSLPNAPEVRTYLEAQEDNYIPLVLKFALGIEADVYANKETGGYNRATATATGFIWSQGGDVIFGWEEATSSGTGDVIPLTPPSLAESIVLLSGIDEALYEYALISAPFTITSRTPIDTTTLVIGTWYDIPDGSIPTLFAQCHGTENADTGNSDTAAGYLTTEWHVRLKGDTAVTSVFSEIKVRAKSTL